MAMLLSVGVHRWLSAGARYLLRLLALFFFLVPVGWLLAPHPVVEIPMELSAVVQSSGNVAGTLPPSPLIPSLVTDRNRLDEGAAVLLFAIWMAGTVAFLVRYWFRRMAYRRYLHCLSCSAVPESVQSLLKQKADLLRLRRVPECVFCRELRSPMVVGLRHRRILLSEEDPNGVGSVLLHELIHCRRGDLWWKLLAEINRCLFWWNPMAWWLVREIEQYSELSCDEAVVLRLENEERKNYGWSILRAAEPLRREPESVAGILLRGAGGRSRSRDVQMLQRRLKLILESRKITRTGKAWIGCTLFLVGMVGMMVGCAASPEKSVQIVSTVVGTDAQNESVVSAPSPEASDIEGSEGAQPTSEDVTDAMYYPLNGDGLYISSDYSDESGHTGIDLAYHTMNAEDEIIYAAKAGTVIFAGWADSDGYKVTIQHRDELETSYAHCGDLLVETGDEVEQGQAIATVGSTGNSCGPHLHFEVRVDGQPQDPQDFFS